MKQLLAVLYGFVTSVRNRLFDTGIFRVYRSQLPVISVGNLTAGGTGKTPLVILIAKKLIERGCKPCVVSRGYGGTVRGPYLLTGSEDARQVGDEPLVIARTVGVPVVIARSRAQGAQFVEQEKLGDVILLDDGFQHRWLARDVDLVAIDVSSEEARKDFLIGDLLPAGRFREGRDKGLERASTVVLSERTLQDRPSEAEPALLRKIPDSCVVFRSFIRSLDIRSLSDGSPLTAKAVTVVCGIANPGGFEQSLKAKGLELVRCIHFPDHHAFTDKDLASLPQDFPIVCTDKDAVRIKCPPGEWYVASPTASVFPEDAFISHIVKLCLQRKLSS